jgi:uncharacterized protein involved in exopolysaccharide biosynthesis
MSVQTEPVTFERRTTNSLLDEGGELAAYIPRDTSSTFELRRMFGFIRRRANWIGATTALAVLGGVVASLVLPPRYTATTSILLDPRGLQVVNRDISARETSSDGQITEAESQRYVVASRKVLAQVIEDERLDLHPLFGARPAGLRTQILSFLGIRPEPSEATAEALRVLEQSVNVKRQEQTYVIDLAVTTADRNLSARLANTIARTYVAQESTARADAARRSSLSLGERAAELRAQVRQAENLVEQFKAENKIVSAGGSLVKEQQLAEVITQLVTARTKRVELQSRLEYIRAVQTRRVEPEALAEALQSPTIGQLRAQYANAKRQEASLSSWLGARHPDYVSAVAQTHELRAQILAEVGRIAQSTATELDRAEMTERGLGATLEKLQNEVVATQQASVQLRELSRDAESKRSVYESFLLRAKELDQQKTLETANIRIITEALPPLNPSGPVPMMIIAASLLLGLGLGSGLAWLRDELAR